MRETSEIMDGECADLNLIANGTKLTYVGWVELNFSLCLPLRQDGKTVVGYLSYLPQRTLKLLLLVLMLLGSFAEMQPMNLIVSQHF